MFCLDDPHIQQPPGALIPALARVGEGNVVPAGAPTAGAAGLARTIPSVAPHTPQTVADCLSPAGPVTIDTIAPTSSPPVKECLLGGSLGPFAYVNVLLETSNSSRPTKQHTNPQPNPAFTKLLNAPLLHTAAALGSSLLWKHVWPEVGVLNQRMQPGFQARQHRQLAAIHRQVEREARDLC